MRNFAFLATLLAVSVEILATRAAALESTDSHKAFEAANHELIECFGSWEAKLAASTEPIDYVADAVFQACDSELKKSDKATKEAFDLLTWSDILQTHDVRKKAIRTRLVVWRERSKSSAGQVATGSVSERQLAEPKTREGKLANCAAQQANWDEWAQERGHVNIGQIEEHANNNLMPIDVDAPAKSAPTPNPR